MASFWVAFLLLTVVGASTCKQGTSCAAEQNAGSNLNLLQVGLSIKASSHSVETTRHDTGAITVPRREATDVALSTELTGQHLVKPVAPPPLGEWLVQVKGVTNPSFIIKDGEVWMFLRRNSRGLATEGREAYISDMVFARMPLNDFRQLGISSVSPKFEIAPDARLQAADRSKTECLSKAPPLSPVYAFGPEDPRIFAFDGKVYMYSVSSDVVTQMQSGAKVEQYTGRPWCAGAHHTYPHLAEILEIDPKIKYGPSVRLIWDKMQKEEKGWSMFQHHPATGGVQLLALYSIVPHIILEIDPTTGKSTMASNTSSQLLADHIQAWNKSEEMIVSNQFVQDNVFHDQTLQVIQTGADNIHGGSGVVFMGGKPQQDPYYLAVLHFCYWTPPPFGVKDYVRNYANYAYKFRAESPFDIISIAKKRLPLKTDGDQSYNGGIAYISSIAHDSGDVVIGYGRSDRLARIYRLPVDDFEQEYFG